MLPNPRITRPQMGALSLILAIAMAVFGIADAQAASAQGATTEQASAGAVKVRKHVRRHVVHPKRKLQKKAVPVRRPRHVASKRMARGTRIHADFAATGLRAKRQIEAVKRPGMDERPVRLADAEVPAVGDPVALRSGSALVIDDKTNEVLLSKNASDVRPIASLTKLMTAAVVLDAHVPMDQMIEITSDDIDTLKWSSSRLRPGMKLSREELLKLALMSSENRAAHALARTTYPGGIDAFMQAMNRKAQQLGMTRTRYIDPTGLSPQNESTAHDLALLVKAVYAYPLIREFSTHQKSTVDVGNRELQYRNTDHLVFNRGWDILLQKTGYINEAGHCLVLNAVVQGRNVIVVLLDAWGKYSHFADAERIRTWMETTGRVMLSRTDAIPADASARLVRTSLSE
ncbi:D-alanyl-D-alanine endopeptidase [Thiomonas sp. FB-Cd]|uniref:D-alanyl-D-alanine endopeptidase n=1 Tax=Thiomonas sp. FB-Cd TaxID=1158292 RepID=UPI00068A54FA|nr:D-alanyl-D-alanine endopeptidase [Thiomonas sp. FB-Cd]